MQVDPDAVQPKIPWGEGPWGPRVFAAVFFVVGVVVTMSELRNETNDASVAGVVVAALAGVVWGIGIWVFDRWWGERPSVQPVSVEARREARRWLPTTLLFLIGLVVSFVVLRQVGAPYGPAFEFSMVPAYFALVIPGLTRRRYVRRHIKAGLVGPSR